MSKPIDKDQLRRIVSAKLSVANHQDDEAPTYLERMSAMPLGVAADTLMAPVDLVDFIASTAGGSEYEKSRDQLKGTIRQLASEHIPEAVNFFDENADALHTLSDDDPVFSTARGAAGLGIGGGIINKAANKFLGKAAQNNRLVAELLKPRSLPSVTRPARLPGGSEISPVQGTSAKPSLVEKVKDVLNTDVVDIAKTEIPVPDVFDLRGFKPQETSGVTKIPGSWKPQAASTIDPPVPPTKQVEVDLVPVDKALSRTIRDVRQQEKVRNVLNKEPHVDPLDPAVVAEPSEVIILDDGLEFDPDMYEMILKLAL